MESLDVVSVWSFIYSNIIHIFDTYVNWDGCRNNIAIHMIFVRQSGDHQMDVNKVSEPLIEFICNNPTWPCVTEYHTHTQIPEWRSENNLIKTACDLKGISNIFHTNHVSSQQSEQYKLAPPCVYCHKNKMFIEFFFLSKAINLFKEKYFIILRTCLLYVRLLVSVIETVLSIFHMYIVQC